MSDLVFTQYTAEQAFDDYTAADGVSTFGGPDDLFGLAELTVEQLQSPEFTVAFDADLVGNTVFVDDITVEVFFEVPYGGYNPDGKPPKNLSPFSEVAIGVGPTGGVRLVAVGVNGLIRTSDDLGLTWVDRNAGSASTLWGVSSCADGFVAVGEQGALLTSADGTTWVAQDVETQEHIFSVVGTKRARVAVAVGKEETVRRRFDGTQPWERRK